MNDDDLTTEPTAAEVQQMRADFQSMMRAFDHGQWTKRRALLACLYMTEIIRNSAVQEANKPKLVIV